MNTHTTVGMMDYLQSELDYWKKGLDAAHFKRLAGAERDDVEIKSARLEQAPRREFTQYAAREDFFPGCRLLLRTIAVDYFASCSVEGSESS